MENSENNTEVIDNENVVAASNERPKFLKVLCILTFVGSGLGILSSIVGFIPSMVETNFDTLSTADLSGLGVFDITKEEYIQWNMYANVSNLIGSMITLMAGLLMWRLRKIGFFIYIPGWIIPTVVGYLAISHLVPSGMIGIGMITQVLSSMVMVAFFIMYGVNFKHLK